MQTTPQNINSPAIKQLRNWAIILVSTSSLIACGLGDKTEAEHISQAKTYITENKQGSAAIELKNALKQNPNNAEARIMLGKYYLAMENGGGAEKEFQIAKKLKQGNTEEIELLYFQALLQQRKIEKILATEEPSIADDTVYNGIKAIQADAFLASGKIDEAKKIIDEALLASPSSPPLLIVKAKIHITHKEYKKAYAALNAASQQAPNNTQAWLLKAGIDFGTNKYTDAQAGFQNVLNIVSTNPNSFDRIDAKLGLAKVDIALKKYDDAKKRVQEIIQISPTHAAANYMLALISYDQKKYKEALQYLQPTLIGFPNLAQPNSLAGAAYYAIGSYERAKEALEIALQNGTNDIALKKLLAEVNIRISQPQKAINILESVLDENSDDSLLLAMIGDAALKSGDIQKGKRYLKKASKIDPESTTIRSELAFAYLAEGKTDEAIQELKHNIKIDKKDIRSWTMLAGAYMQQKKTNEALSTLKTLERDMPNSPEPANELGSLYGVIGNKSKARHYIEKSLSIKSDYIPAMLNMALLENASGNPNIAKKWYDKILVAAPTQKEALLGSAKYDLQHGNKQAALEKLEKARSLYKNFAAPLIILTQVYLQDGLIQKSRDAITEAIKLVPKNPAVQQGYGSVLLASGETQKAIKVIQKLLKTHPRADIYYQLAQAQRMSRNLKETKAALSKALELNPEHMPSLMLSAFVYQSTGNTAKASEIYKKIISRKPNVFALNNLAMLTLETNKTHALELAKQAYEMDTSAPYADTLGWILLKNGKTEQSLKYLTEAYKGAGGDESIGYHLASALTEAGRKNEAKTLLLNIVGSKVKFRELNEAKQLLNSL